MGDCGCDGLGEADEIPVRAEKGCADSRGLPLGLGARLPLGLVLGLIVESPLGLSKGEGPGDPVTEMRSAEVAEIRALRMSERRGVGSDKFTEFSSESELSKDDADRNSESESDSSEKSEDK